MSVVEAHHCVMIELQNDDRFQVVPHLNDNYVKAWKKTKFQAKDLIGKPYGALFEVRDNKLVRLDEPPNVTELLRLAKKHGEDNRNLKMAGDAQGLTQEQIEGMKKEGKHAEEIIAALMANSSTLETKTQFAQEKWLRKKMAKYVSFFRIVKPTTAALARAFYNKDPHRIERMRWDALAWMLNAADLRHKSKPLVIDGVGGMLVGAVAERTYGNCEITAVNQTDHKHIISFFNFPENVKSSIRFVPFEKMSIAANTHTSLLVAVSFMPLSLIHEVWPGLCSGSPFAIYSQYPNAFTDIMMWLRKEQRAVEVRLTEIFLRQYQVLEGRTHPDMQMDNASGFVLTGVKVDPTVFAENASQVAASQRFVDKKGKKKGANNNNNKGKEKPSKGQNKKEKEEDEDEEEDSKDKSKKKQKVDDQQ